MRICWADDTLEEAKSFSSVFASIDAEVEFAEGGQEAIDAIRARSFDLVITDLRMPPGDWGGLWLLEHLQAIETRPPVIVLSGQGSQAETIQALRLGATDYVDKTNVAAELLERAQRAVADASEAMVRGPETDHVEFKETLRIDREGAVNREVEHASVKTIAAFANSAGGTLVIGRTDQGAMTGLGPDLASLKEPTHDKFELYLRELITRTAGAAVNQGFQVRFSELDGLAVALVAVSPVIEPVFVRSKDRHGRDHTAFYIRAGNGTRELAIDEAWHYMLRRFRAEK